MHLQSEKSHSYFLADFLLGFVHIAVDEFVTGWKFVHLGVMLTRNKDLDA